MLHHDESWYVGLAWGGGCWGERGKPNWIPSFGPKQGQVLYLSRDAASDELFWSWQQHTRSDETIAHLAQLVACYHKKRYLVVIWDNASWHTSQKIRHWLAAHNQQAAGQGLPRLFVYCLPTYSPWLNPTEAVFTQNKRRSLFGQNQPDASALRRRVEANLCYFHPQKTA